MRLKLNASAAPSWLVCAVLVLVTLAIYVQTYTFEFVHLDDPDMVVNNPYVQQGLTGESIRWAFGEFYMGFWMPLTWLSLMLDVTLFGQGAAGHHMVNAVLHSINGAMLFLAMRTLTKNFWASAFIAALFAWHPLRVESVAWVTERKDVLSGLCFMSCLWAYAGYAQRKSFGLYGLSALCLVLGLMAKPMLVTVPLVLLLLDFWPLRRVTRQTWRGVLLEKIPLLAIVATFCVLTVTAHREFNAMTSLKSLTMDLRIENAVVSYARYLGKFIWPQRLAAVYPHPGIPRLEHWDPALVVGSAVLLLTITVFGLMQMRRRPYLIVGWLWFVGMLVPVIGLTQAGTQAMADRFTYLPSIGLALIVTFGALDVAQRCAWPSRMLWGTGGVVLAACVVWSAVQTTVWQNSLTLFDHAAKVTDRNWFALSNVGYERRVRGQHDEAIAALEGAIEANPALAGAYCNLGLCYATMPNPDLDKAISILEQAVVLAQKTNEPQTASAALNALGVCHVQIGQIDRGIACYEAALSIDPNDELARSNRSDALRSKRAMMKH